MGIKFVIKSIRYLENKQDVLVHCIDENLTIHMYYPVSYEEIDIMHAVKKDLPIQMVNSLVTDRSYINREMESD